VAASSCLRNFACCVSAVILLSSAAGAQPADPPFKGKTVYMYIGPGQPGGSYDLFARLLARYIGRYLPGEPTVIPQNRNGAAGLLLANYLYSVAPRDGTAMGIIAEAAALSQALETPGVRYDVSKFNWIGRLASSVNISLTWHTSKVQSAADAMKIEVPIAATQPGAAAFDQPTMLNSIAGTKFKVIPGYRGSIPMLLAMERGETDGAFTDWSTFKISHAHWLDEKKVRIIVQYALQRQPDLPDVPTAVELGRTSEDKQLLRLFVSSADVGRAFVAPPGLPPERVKMLRDAFDGAINDPSFLAEVAQSKIILNPLSGERLQRIIEDVAHTPPMVLGRARSLVKP
jgi:tripartite-type tricarboxylate transporter receptor subunit TctC